MFGCNVFSHTISHFAGAINWCDTACRHFSNFVVRSLTLPLLEIALTVTDAIGKASWNYIIYLLSYIIIDFYVQGRGMYKYCGQP